MPPREVTLQRILVREAESFYRPNRLRLLAAHSRMTQQMRQSLGALAMLAQASHNQGP